MRSNSPFRKDSCAEQKAKMKAKYKKDFGNLKEYEKEGGIKGRHLRYSNNCKIIWSLEYLVVYLDIIKKLKL